MWPPSVLCAVLAFALSVIAYAVAAYYRRR